MTEANASPKNPTRLNETGLWSDVRRDVERLILEQTRKQLGSDALPQETLGKGYTMAWERVPRPEGIRLALMVQSSGRRLVEEYAAKLRGKEGWSWEQIFPLLGLEYDPDGSRARDEMAYEFILGPDTRTQYLMDPRYVSWECGSCSGWVRDRGPFNSHPTDCEDGHADGCTRHQAEIAAYLKSRSDYEDGEDGEDDGGVFTQTGGDQR